MLDATLPPPALQRARGAARVTLKSRGGAAVLDGLRQEGCAKAILPRTDATIPEVVFLNTAGGLTGGDRLRYHLTLADGLTAVATTQTAERAYAAGSGCADVEVSLKVGAEGWLDWLPQETILFDGAALDRRVTLDLGPGAGCMFLETVVLGRHAMGETVQGLSLRDHRMVTRNGVPLWSEPMMLDSRAVSRASGPAMLGGARAMATLALVHPAAGDLLAPLRAALDEAGVEAAASAFDGRLTLRALAWDGLPLRRLILRALVTLRPHLPSCGPLPRVWQT
jgi:urease accessory protein